MRRARPYRRRRPPEIRGRLRRSGLAAALVAAATLTASGCAFIEGQPKAPAVAGTATTDSAGVQHVTIEGHDDLTFSPNVVHAHPGTLVITLVDAGNTPHDLDVPALHSAIPDIMSGQSRTLTLHFVHAGDYRFVCLQHSFKPMDGVIQVR